MSLRCWLVVALSLPGCGAAVPRTAEPQAGDDLRLQLVVGEEHAERFEAHLGAASEGGGTLRLRRSTPVASWPPLYSATWESRLTPQAMRQLGVALERSGFFALPPLIEERSGGAPVLLRVRHLGREHQVLAHGRLLPGLERALLAIDEAMPLVLSPWPSWAGGRWTQPRGRPGLVPDVAGAIACHRRWLAQEPSRAALRLDLAVLLAAALRRDEAEAELTALAADPYLGGFVPELRRVLFEPPFGR